MKNSALCFVSTLLVIVSTSTSQAAIADWTDFSGDNTWTNANNWSNSITPAPTNDVYFIDVGAAGLATSGPTGTPDNVVTTNATIASLNYDSTNFNHTTLINPGTTLTVVGPGASAYAVFAGTLIDTGFNTSESHTINGPGAALVITNFNGALSVRQGEVTSGHTATLNMMGLDTLVAVVTNVLSGGELIGKDTGTLYLAKTNYIQCTAPSNTPGLIVGNNNTSGSKTANAYLGLSNVFLSDGGISIPQTRMTGNLNFYSNNSTAYFRNKAGTGFQNQWQIGWNDTSGTGTGCTGTASFALGTVDAIVGTLIVGASEYSGSSTGGGTGTLTFDGGSMVANTVEIGENMGDLAGPTTGIINIAGINAPAVFTVNSNLYLAAFTGGTPTASPSATLNIGPNSTVSIFGNVVCGSEAATTTISALGCSLYFGGTVGASGTTTGALGALVLSNTSLTFNLGVSPNPVNALISVGTLEDLTNCALTIEGGGISDGQFSVIKYGSIFYLGFATNIALTLPPQASGYLSNNIANNSIDLVITNVSAPIWNGVPNGNWDINETANWKTSTGAATTYQQSSIPGELVTFNDTATGTTAINLVDMNLGPSGVSVNNSALNYTFTGAGAIVGPTGLTKAGTGSLIIANTGTNSFTGPIGITGGLLQLGISNALPATANVTLSDVAGATLDLNNYSQTIAALSGGGSDGGGNVTLGSGTLTINGNGGTYGGIISGNGGLVMAGGSQLLSGQNTYSGGTLITGGNLILANDYAGSATGSGGIVIQGGSVQFGAGQSGYDGQVAATAITNNGQVIFDGSDGGVVPFYISGTGSVAQEGPGPVIINGSNSYTGGTILVSGPISIDNAGALGPGLITIDNLSGDTLELQGNITLTNNFLLTSKGGALDGDYPVIDNESDTNALTGNLSVSSAGTDVPFKVDGGQLTVGGSFGYISAGSGENLRLQGSATGVWEDSVSNGTGYTIELIKEGPGTWTLTGSSINTYTSNTVVNDGTLIVDGRIGSPLALMVNNGSVLAGSGVIASPVVIAGSYLDPGDTNAPLNVSNVLTINNSLTIESGSITVFNASETNGALACEQVSGLTSVSYNGELVVNFAGTLSGHEVFHLFNANSYSGSFSSIVLPQLQPGLTWNTNMLAVDGTLRLNVSLSIQSAALTGGGGFQLTGTFTPDVSGQPYRILATTNLALPVSAWTQVSSGTLTTTPFTYSDTSRTTDTQRYYILVTP